MLKVQCKVCSETGYTAAPDYVVCKCGGKFKVIPENGESEKAELGEEAIRLFDTSRLIK